jgi:hypothetical protein
VRRTRKKERKTSAVRSRVLVSSPAMDLEMETARVRNDPRSTSIVDAFEIYFFIIFFQTHRCETGDKTYPNQAKKLRAWLAHFPLKANREETCLRSEFSTT